jgi:hypothetical protein
MILSGNKLRDDTIHLLSATNGVSVETLKENLEVDEKTIPNSTIYKMLNKLINEEVAVKQGTRYFLNAEWRQDLIKYFEINHRQVLEEGERLTYKLNSVYEIDRHWKHYAYQIEKELQDRFIYFFNPHQFWIYLENRGKTEDIYIQHLAKKKLRVRHTIGNDTSWDKKFSQTYRSKTYRINTGLNYIFTQTDNISVFGDYFLNTKVTEDFYQNIHRAYIDCRNETELELRINQISKNSPCKLILERNNKKAARLRRLLSKDFAVV